MPYALYREKKAVSPLYPTQDELWGFVRANGFCSEVQEREDQPARRVLNLEYYIFQCGSDGVPVDDRALPNWRFDRTTD